MDHEIDRDFVFYSTRFGIAPAETEETNPYLFGRELANWLGGQLNRKGYTTEVIAEDWGWCVICQRDPFRLFASCVSGMDENLLERCRNPESDAEIMWLTSVHAELSIFKRLRGSADTDAALAKLGAYVRAILEEEPSIRFATKEQIAAWEDSELDPDLPRETIEKVETQKAEPAAVPWWITIPIGLVLLPVLALALLFPASFLTGNSQGYEIIGPLIGLGGLLLLSPLVLAVLRMIFRWRPPHGGLFPPFMLRIFAGLFLVPPIAGVFAGWYVEDPIRAVLMAMVSVAISTSLWRLSTARKRKMQRQRRTQDG